MNLRVLFLAVGISLLFAGEGRADSTTLPGSQLSLNRAAAKAGAVFSGKLLNLGPASFPSGGQTGYFGNQVRVAHRLASWVGFLATVSFFTHDDAGEEPPDVGGQYIFFVSKNGTGDLDPFTAFKVVPLTPENLAAAKKAIAKARAEKREKRGEG